MDLQSKILSAFQGMVVRKDLAFQIKGGLPVPTYVMEYLLAQYCATDNESVINDGVEKVNTGLLGVNYKKISDIKDKFDDLVLTNLI